MTNLIRFNFDQFWLAALASGVRVLRFKMVSDFNRWGAHCLAAPIKR